MSATVSQLLGSISAVAVLHAVSINGTASKAGSRRFKIGDLSRGNILKSTRMCDGLNIHHTAFCRVRRQVAQQSFGASGPRDVAHMRGWK